MDALFWRDVSVLYSSPEEKALATVQPSAVRHGFEVNLDDRLREAKRPAFWYEDYAGVACRYLRAADSPEGWEPSPFVERRMGGFFEELERRHFGENSVAACSRGLALALYLSRLPSFRADIVRFWRGIGFCRVAVLQEGVLQTLREPEKVR